MRGGLRWVIGWRGEIPGRANAPVLGDAATRTVLVGPCYEVVICAVILPPAAERQGKLALSLSRLSRCGLSVLRPAAEQQQERADSTVVY
ncbi:hypothetical protein CBR_g280 [Chara braunii]|uniref:Uncharacterized protein n=1 Tax=Chara braunii TaxID=69332 RepID=A0A388JM83_CHABU|nr:hypothetical protein CBR_g280 [Chara braunii]|eukprot:GBG58881.1 hypothetical protein CBR_g280 [Chara braunii]